MLYYYELALQSKIEFLVILIVLIIICRLTLGSKDLIIASVCTNYGVYFSVSFYFLSAINYKDISDLFRILFLLVFETFILIKFLLIFKDFIKKYINSSNHFPNYLLTLLIIRSGIFIFLISTNTYGVFSSGERIDFISTNWYLKYLVYLSNFLAFIQLILVAEKYNTLKKQTFWSILTIIQVIIISVFSGSKGAWILWIIGLTGLTYKTLRDNKILIKLVLSFSMIALVIINLSLDYFGLNATQFTELAFARFFLNNDARALSLDFTDAISQNKDFFTHSWRSFSSFFVESNRDVPIGNLLYEEAFNGNSSLGANSSLSALITYYVTNLNFIPIILTLILLIHTYHFLLKKALYQNSKLLYFSISLFTIPLFSQDFLSFQLMSRIILLIILFLALFRLLKFKSR